MKDNINALIKGRLELDLVDGDVVVDTFAVDNLVTDWMTLLLSRLSSNEGIPGITHFALGTGVGTGTAQDPEPPFRSMETLREEFIRVPITGYLFDDNAGVGANTVTDGFYTNRLILSGELETQTSNNITEAALIGGTSGGTGSGYMVNVVTFPFVTKPANLSLRFRWILTFRSV